MPTYYVSSCLNELFKGTRAKQKETFPFGPSALVGLMETAPYGRDGGTFLIFSCHAFQKTILTLFKLHFCHFEDNKLASPESTLVV